MNRIRPSSIYKTVHRDHKIRQQLAIKVERCDIVDLAQWLSKSQQFVPHKTLIPLLREQIRKLSAELESDEKNRLRAETLKLLTKVTDQIATRFHQEQLYRVSQLVKSLQMRAETIEKEDQSIKSEI
jgi:GAF domain-containing protein